MSPSEQQQVPEGYKVTEAGVIPEDWDIKLLSEVCNKITDGTHDTPKPVITGVPFLTAIHVKENKIDFEGCYYLPKDVHDEIYRRCNPERNDVLMVNIGAGVATSALVNVDYEFSLKNVALIKPNKSKLLGQYLNYYQSYVKYKVFESLSSGGAQPFLSLFQIGQLKASLPPIEEQTAIADALSDVDGLIGSLEKLITKKRAIKTAAMQQLLTGKKRLPPFCTGTCLSGDAMDGKEPIDQTHTGYKQTDLGEIPNDWEIDSIGRVLSITTGDKNTQDKVGDGQYPFFVRSQTIERINSYSFDGEAVLTAGDGVGTGKIFHYINGKFDYHQRVYLMHNFCNRLDGYYFYIYFSNNFYDRIMSMTAKSSVDSVRREMIADMKIVMPPIDEQIEISKALTDMDKDIEALEQRLNKTQQLKQGMMQELLTGRTRLVKSRGELRVRRKKAVDREKQLRVESE